MAGITHIVLHYSATFEDQYLTVKDIDKMHRDRGWKMVGYHWIIRRDGVVEQGRPESMVGAHVGGHNTGKIGICCIGGVNRATGPNKGVDNRTPAQIKSLIRLVEECLRRHPGAKVVGHRDLASTQCPGFDAQTWWAEVKGAPLPMRQPTSSGDPVKTGVLGEDKDHLVEPGETWWSVAHMHGIALGELLLMNDAEPGDILVAGRILRLKHKNQPNPVPAAPPPAPKPATGPAAVGVAAGGAAVAVVTMWDRITAFFGGLF